MSTPDQEDLRWVPTDPWTTAAYDLKGQCLWRIVIEQTRAPWYTLQRFEQGKCVWVKSWFSSILEAQVWAEQYVPAKPRRNAWMLLGTILEDDTT